ncbi:MAG TPA: response regulator [Longimicrobiales bacterium]|nr:response regulator [Longimicrobiales bacterium]
MASDEAPRGQLILVEDDPASRGVLALLFEAAGWKVAEAADGRGGLTLARRLAPDVVVTDLRMPGMSGIELAVELQGCLGSLPVVAITSDRASLREAALRSGLFAEVLVKPLAPGPLLEAVLRASRGAGGAARGEKSRGPARGRSGAGD